MTLPVREEDAGRRAARLGYTARQLQRRPVSMPELPGPFALQYHINSTIVDDTYDYPNNVDTPIGWSTQTVSANGDDTFEVVADVGDGNAGIRILRPGWYRIWLKSSIGVPGSLNTENPERRIPPYVHIWPASDIGDLNGEFSSFTPVGCEGGLTWRFDDSFSTEITPDGEPDDPDWGNIRSIRLGAQFDHLMFDNIYVPTTMSAMIRSSRATLPWAYSETFMYLLRLADIRDS